jgi:hypothetical protein
MVQQVENKRYVENRKVSFPIFHFSESLLDLYFFPEDGDDMFLPYDRLPSNHGVTTNKPLHNYMNNSNPKGNTAFTVWGYEVNNKYIGLNLLGAPFVFC